MSEFGDSTLNLINEVLDDGAQHIVVLVRHSAREFIEGKNDMLNPLTDEGRELALRLGRLLPKSLLVRSYASPVERCIETAELILRGHDKEGGATTRNRPIEALGVFYILDQMRWYMAMRDNGGMVSTLGRWFEGKIPVDVMMPPDQAANLIFKVAAGKLDHPIQVPQLDVLVSHDMTVFTVRDRLLNQIVADYPVEFLDGLVIFEKDGKRFLQSHHGPARDIPMSS